MRRQTRRMVLAAGVLLAAVAVGMVGTAVAAEPPAVGDRAKDFELSSLGGGQGKDKVKLSDRLKSGPVVLIVLRGYPGYQCPLCTRQVGELTSKADDFRKAGATVLLV